MDRFLGVLCGRTSFLRVFHGLEGEQAEICDQGY